jgi:hypothetical protein
MSAVLMVVFFAGLVLTILEIYLYRVTIVPWIVPFLIWLITGLALVPLIRTRLALYLKMDNLFYQIIYSVLGLGGVAMYLFIAVNYYTVSGPTSTHTFKIVGKSSMPGPKGSRSERRPLVHVHYFDREKELVFHFSDTKRVERADSVTIDVKTGGLGFDVVVHFDVIDG